MTVEPATPTPAEVCDVHVCTLPATHTVLLTEEVHIYCPTHAYGLIEALGLSYVGRLMSLRELAQQQVSLNDSALVDDAARAMYESGIIPSQLNWLNCSEDVRESWRILARAALAVVCERVSP